MKKIKINLKVLYLYPLYPLYPLYLSSTFFGYN